MKDVTNREWLVDGKPGIEMTREEAVLYFARASGDLNARWILNQLAERALNVGDRKTSVLLQRAAIFMMDRESYAKNHTGVLEINADGEMRWNMGDHVVPILTKPRAS